MVVRYQCRPSQLVDIEDAYTSFCFDEACFYIIQQLAKDNTPRFKSKHKSFRDLYAGYTN